MMRATPTTLACCLALALSLTAGCSSDDGDKNDGGTPQTDASTPQKDGTTPQPDTGGGMFITITSPTAGAQWKVGSEQKIAWDTSLEDVSLSYSTDGGETWKKISDSVDTMSPGWKSLPWTVPAEPTDKAMIEIKGYGGEIPTRSEVFSIVE